MQNIMAFFFFFLKKWDMEDKILFLRGKKDAFLVDLFSKKIMNMLVLLLWVCGMLLLLFKFFF